jgi:hypothetical protein
LFFLPLTTTNHELPNKQLSFHNIHRRRVSKRIALGGVFIQNYVTSEDYTPDRLIGRGPWAGLDRNLVLLLIRLCISLLEDIYTNHASAYITQRLTSLLWSYFALAVSSLARTDFPFSLSRIAQIKKSDSETATAGFIFLFLLCCSQYLEVWRIRMAK